MSNARPNKNKSMSAEKTSEKSPAASVGSGALVRRSLSFQPYEIELILKGLAALRDVEHHSCKWEKQGGSNQYYYTPNAAVKRIAFIERSIARQLSTPNARGDRAHAETVKLRTALNQIAHPTTYGTTDMDPRDVARRALILEMTVAPLPSPNGRGEP